MYTVQPFPFCGEEEARMEPITALGESLAGGRLFRFLAIHGAWTGEVINCLCTASAHLVTRYRLGPVALQIRAWAWLAA
jgi:hypothetical protein